MRWTYHDGGREAAGFRSEAKGDCVCRSIVIATGRPYRSIYETLEKGCKSERLSRGRKRSTPGIGIRVKRKWFRDYMESLGFRWVPCMGIGTGCQVHLSAGELPKGRLVVKCSRHFTAVIDGVIYDTHDPSRGGSRCVYGYFIFQSQEQAAQQAGLGEVRLLPSCLAT